MFDYLKGRTPSYIDEEYYRKYAVMVPLVQREDGLYVLFEVRSDKLKRQPGEICFPGGRRDGSETAMENAIRETMEELLVRRDQIDVIAQMNTMLTFYDNEVSVFLGQLKDYEMTFSMDENAEIFLVPLQYFMEHEPEKYVNTVTAHTPEDFPYDKVPGGRNYAWHPAHKNIYFYFYEDRVIWGLTAYIMQGVIRTMKAEKPQEP